MEGRLPSGGAGERQSCRHRGLADEAIVTDALDVE
jgi:hypothetical protein